MTNACTTEAGKELRRRLGELDDSVPKTWDFIMLLSLIHRHAATKARQDEAFCNHEWASTAAYQGQMRATKDRLVKLGEELAEAWPGASLQMQNDPRGFVVRIHVPNGRNEAWAGGLGVA